MNKLFSLTTPLPAKLKITEFYHRFSEPVNGKYLGWFRTIAFGLMALEVIQFSQRGYLQSFLVETKVRFPYEMIPVSVDFTQAGLNMLLGMIIFSAILCSIGLFYKYARWVFFLSFTFFFFQDKMLWNNHWYLFLLIGISSLVLDLNRVFSLDAVLAPKTKTENVPRWYYGLLAFQIGHVYFFGGIAKINHDWLVLHQPIGSFLEQRVNYFVLGNLFSQPWASTFFAWGGMFFDLGITFLLINRKTIKLGLFLSLFFNIFNSMVFDIGMFPYFMIVSNLLFLGLVQPLENHGIGSTLAISKPIKLILVLFVSFQILFPLRQFLFNGNPSWIGICERFSWRMMIQTKDVETFKFYAVDTRNGNRQEIDPSSFLFPQQMVALVVFPEMVPPVAKQMKAYFGKKGLKAFEVHAEVKASMNGRHFQPMIDQEVALSNYEYQPISPPSYVIPLE